ncbi:hypothetical protein LUZ60_013788 [Juncus effusus]|nr:hypothetical protein LUZ60_013788 [Juncus effusus]
MEEVTDYPPLEVSLKQKLQSTKTWESFEPFVLSRLPYMIRENNRELYEPRVVSIGPYHRGKESLLAMEAHKPRCLIDFLDRNPTVGLEVYVKEMRALETRARKCYSEIIDMSKDEFTEMLLLDGCFILEFFLKVRAREPHVLLDVGWGTKTIVSDLLLFENQIPFFVIETLYSILTSNEGESEILLRILQPSSISPDLPVRDKIYHLLHLYYQWFIPGRISQCNWTQSSISVSSRSTIWPSDSPRFDRNTCPDLKSISKSNSFKPYNVPMQSIPSAIKAISKSNSIKPYNFPMRSIPCATELHEAGVTFKKKVDPIDVFDITFENGVMEIPTLMIDSVRKVFYMNLAAFERSRGSMEHDLMSYVMLMDSLINTNKDVALLQRHGILNNMLLNDEDLSVFFNRLGDWSTLESDTYRFAPLFKDVQKYYNSRWHKYRAKLVHDYFSNPWSALSVMAAIMLLILAGIQAAYQMYPFVHHSN